LERGLLHFALAFTTLHLKKRDAEGGVEPRGQACEFLLDTGIRVARDWKWNPVGNRTSLCGFANRRLNCSANG